MRGRSRVVEGSGVVGLEDEGVDWDGAARFWAMTSGYVVIEATFKSPAT